MKYYLVWIEDEQKKNEVYHEFLSWGRFLPVAPDRALSDAEAGEILTNLKIKRLAGYEEFYFECLIENIKDVQRENQDFNPDNIDELVHRLGKTQRLFINVLGIFYTYIGHYEKHFKKDSAENKVHVYRNNSLFLFLWELRKFSTHIAMPFLTTWNHDPQSAYICKSDLENYKNSDMQIFLDDSPDFIKLSDLLRDLSDLMTKFHDELVKEKEQEFQAAANKLCRYANDRLEYPKLVSWDGQKLYLKALLERNTHPST